MALYSARLHAFYCHYDCLFCQDALTHAEVDDSIVFLSGLAPDVVGDRADGNGRVAERVIHLLVDRAAATNIGLQTGATA